VVLYERIARLPGILPASGMALTWQQPSCATWPPQVHVLKAAILARRHPIEAGIQIDTMEARAQPI